jgi:hypothetical protein
MTTKYIARIVIFALEVITFLFGVFITIYGHFAIGLFLSILAATRVFIIGEAMLNDK